MPTNPRSFIAIWAASKKKKFESDCRASRTKICDKKKHPAPMEKKRGEMPVHSFTGCFSMDRHVHATEYEEIINFCQKNGFYYAVKAEDTNCITEMGWPDTLTEDTLGKVHLHFVMVREFACHAPDAKDTRYGGSKVSHMKAKCLRECPSLAAALADSRNARTYALLFTKMTSDHAVAYLNKEAECKKFELPCDLVVLRPYISLKEARKFNPEDDAHVKAYKEAGYPVPATIEQVWDYVTTRWYEKNDAKRVKRKALQIEAAENLLHAINQSKPPLPRALATKYGNEMEEAPMKKAKVRYCPRCPTELCDNDSDEVYHRMPNILEAREQYCWECKEYTPK